MPVVNYHLRDDLMGLTVCLYNAHAEEKYTTDTLQNYILDCAWQLEQGQPVKRVPFYITVSPVDAERAIQDLKQSIQMMRKASNQEESELSKQITKSWGWSGGYSDDPPKESAVKKTRRK